LICGDAPGEKQGAGDLGLPAGDGDPRRNLRYRHESAREDAKDRCQTAYGLERDLRRC
jgi:hypothetical protein